MLNREEEVINEISNYYNLFLRYSNYLCKNQDDAEDLLQTSYLKAISWIKKNNHKLSLDFNFKSWMYKIIKNTFINDLNKKRIEVINTGYDVSELCDYKLNVIEDFNKDILYNEILKSLEYLKDNYKLYAEVFILHEIYNLSISEISIKLNIPIGTVKSRLSRAKKLILDNIN